MRKIKGLERGAWLLRFAFLAALTLFLGVWQQRSPVS